MKKIGLATFIILLNISLILGFGYDNPTIPRLNPSPSLSTTTTITSGNTTNFTNYWTTNTNQLNLIGNKQYLGNFTDEYTKNSLNLNKRILYDGQGDLGIDYINGILYAINFPLINTKSAYYSIRQLLNSSEDEVMDWENLNLIGNWTKNGKAICLSDGTNCGNPFDQSLNTTDDVIFNQVSIDSSSLRYGAIPYSNGGILSDTGFSGDGSGNILDAGGYISIDAIDRILYASDGFTALIDFGSYIGLYDTSGVKSVDWISRTLRDTADTFNVLSWNDGNITVTNDVIANKFYGDGSKLTGIKGMNYTNLAMTNRSNNFTGTQNIGSAIADGNVNIFSTTGLAFDYDHSLKVIDTTNGYGTVQSSSSIDGVLVNSDGSFNAMADLYLNYYSTGNVYWGIGGLGSASLRSDGQLYVEQIYDSVGGSVKSIEPKNRILYGSNGVESLNYYTSNNIKITGNLNVSENVTVNSLIKLKSITLPSCNSATNGSIARNNTKLYFCDGSIWNGLY